MGMLTKATSTESADIVCFIPWVGAKAIARHVFTLGPDDICLRDASGVVYVIIGPGCFPVHTLFSLMQNWSRGRLCSHAGTRFLTRMG